MGDKVPFWDSRDEFGDTIADRGQAGGRRFAGARARGALGRADAPAWRDRRRQDAGGARPSAPSTPRATRRCRFRRTRWAMVSPLSAAETALAGEYNLRPGPVARAWEYWSVRLDKAEGTLHKRAPSRTPLEQASSVNAARARRNTARHWPRCVEPVISPASSAARNTTQRAISSGSPRRPIGISGRIDFSSTSFGTACTISVLM